MGRRATTIYRENLAATLAEAKAGEGKLADLYQETANRVRLAIATRGETISAADLAAEIDEAFQSTLMRRVRAIRTSIEHAAKQGPKAARATFRATYEGATTTAQVRTGRKALEEAAERIAGRVTVDGVSLSRRVRKWDRELGTEMAREVQGGIRSKQGILGIAKKIEKLDAGYEAKLPKYLQEVEELARQGKLKELRGVTKAYAARARRTLGEMQANGTLKASKYSLRSATQKYLRDIAKAGPEGVDRVVKEYVTERAAYQARLIARTEATNAFRRSYVEQSKNKPGVVGYRWTLSGRHPVEDECDILAEANQHGLGPGVFPADKIPQHPHPNCICGIVAVMDERHFERPVSQRVGVPDDMRDTESPDAVGWMINNAGKAERIVGPTRWAAFKQGIDVLDHEGRPKLVRDILPRMGRQAAE